MKRIKKFILNINQIKIKFKKFVKNNQTNDNPFKILKNINFS